MELVLGTGPHPSHRSLQLPSIRCGFRWNLKLDAILHFCTRPRPVVFCTETQGFSFLFFYSLFRTQDRIVSYMHTLGLEMHDAEHFFDIIADHCQDAGTGRSRCCTLRPPLAPSHPPKCLSFDFFVVGFPTKNDKKSRKQRD